MTAPPAKGRFLVAAPALEDPNFHRAVVFLLAADRDGALGVVLNRPSDTGIDEVVPHWSFHASSPPVLFVGGPVQPNAAICVGQVSGGTASTGSRDWSLEAPEEGSEGAKTAGGEGVAPSGGVPEPVPEDADDSDEGGYSPLVGDLGTVDLNRGPDDIDVSFAGLRVFTGYSGWGPGQLEDEIEAGAWFVIEGKEADVLSPEPEKLWEELLRRQGGWLAVLARHPVDASLN